MQEQINPFHDLYLTEAIGSDSFVDLFSPIFISQGSALYQPGNVILKGLQGSGKTMLLNLLKTDVRIAYNKKNIEFPVPKKYRKFISAGINLRKSGVAEFSQLILPNSSEKSIRELALHFGDFVNYWVVQDIFDSIESILHSNNNQLMEEVGINSDFNALDKFATIFSASDCWLNGIERVRDYQSLKKQIENRIFHYRNYLNLNIDELPDKIVNTKTVIGEPIAIAAELLRSLEVIDNDVNVFIKIDQYEELPTLDHSGSNFGFLCQQLVHKALSSRSSRVSYRIGVRQYAWPEKPTIFSTTGCLENKRDYSVINIDEKLRRTENRRTWLFPSLAEDIFSRRIRLTDYKPRKSSESLLNDVFGRTLTARKKAQLLATTNQSRKAMIKTDDDWPSRWTAFVKNLAIDDPYSAKLAEAWVRQKDPKKKNVMFEESIDPPYPWEKQYWKKERSEQALTQIASRNKQQLIWQGKEDVLGLSGGNILVFLFICQHIWDAWLRDSQSDTDYLSYQLPLIDNGIQSIGILNASEEWQKKPIEGKESKKRLKFIQKAGERYYKYLIDDLSMSYPGRNGFSVSITDLDDNKYVSEYLKVAVDYGDIYEGPHTSKSKGEKRRKYYLAPILCPAFKIPYKHTKEPEYIRATALQGLLDDGSTSPAEINQVVDNNNQIDFFE
jgi:hypothetical protein